MTTVEFKSLARNEKLKEKLTENYSFFQTICGKFIQNVLEIFCENPVFRLDSSRAIRVNDGILRFLQFICIESTKNIPKVVFDLSSFRSN